MAAVVTHSPAHDVHVEEPQTDGTAQRPSDSRGETLEDVILRVWEDLVAGRFADCPACGGSMSLLDCKHCGAELS